MRKFVLILILILVTGVSFSQEARHSLTVGLDPANVVGSSKGTQGLDFMAKYTFNANEDDVFANDEVGLYYERFHNIQYESYGVFFNRVFYPKIENTELAIGIEGSRIHRWEIFTIKTLPPTFEPYNHTYWWSYGANIEPRYIIDNSLMISIQMNLRRRPLWKQWVYSNFLLISYTF